MKDSYPDDIMLCFVQGYDGERKYKRNECTEVEAETNNNSSTSKKKQRKRLTVKIDKPDLIEENVELRNDSSPETRETRRESRNAQTQSLITGKSLRLSSGDRFRNRLPEVKRSFSDRFSVVTDPSGKRASKGLLTIRKTWYVYTLFII